MPVGVVGGVRIAAEPARLPGHFIGPGQVARAIQGRHHSQRFLSKLARLSVTALQSIHDGQLQEGVGATVGIVCRAVEVDRCGEIGATLWVGRS